MARPPPAGDDAGTMRALTSSPLLVAAAATAVALAAPPPAGAAFPGRNGLLAVVAGDNPARARPQIVLLRPADGSVVRRVPDAARWGDTWPAWSPDGRLLAFDAGLGADETRLAVVRADGTHRRTLPRPAPGVNAIAPAWLPDGGRIAFGATGFDIGGVWTVDRSGGDVRRLTRSGQLPSFSTSGFLAVGDGGLGIWRMHEDGTHRVRLAGRGSDDPDWSPHGSRIAYTRVRDGVEEVWTMRRSGRGKRRLARGSMPAWSPDGRHIAFVRGGRISIMGAGGGAVRRLAYAPTGSDGRPVRLVMPAWQPVPR